MPDQQYVVDESDVLRIYKIWEKNPALDASVFQTVAFAYHIGSPDSASILATLYVTQGANRLVDKPLGDQEYVAGLFDFALRQPRSSNVWRSAAMAIGLSVIPEHELGKATKEERYLAFHGAAQLAQNDAALLGRELIVMRDRASMRIFTLPNVVIVLGFFTILWIAFSGG